ncbi:hypothetical protein MK746_20855 [Bacillus sp. 1006-3]|nr:hypothetical protein [Bacillus sp. 1006-3]
MLPTSFKAKIQRLLIKNGFKKSSKTKGRIRGLDNYTDGFDFEKSWDDYYLFYTCGNTIYRGMSQRDQDRKTEKMYEFLVDQGLEDHVKLTGLRSKKVILLKP